MKAAPGFRLFPSLFIYSGCSGRDKALNKHTAIFIVCPKDLRRFVYLYMLLSGCKNHGLFCIYRIDMFSKPFYRFIAGKPDGNIIIVGKCLIIGKDYKKGCQESSQWHGLSYISRYFFTIFGTLSASQNGSSPRMGTFISLFISA